MKMQGERLIRATRQDVWNALNDPDVLKQCIPGCEEMQKLSDTAFAAKVRAKVGPVSLIMTGDVQVTPTARRLGQSVLYPTRLPPRWLWDAAHLPSVSVLPSSIRTAYGITWNPSRERAVAQLAAVSRKALPMLPPAMRYVPSALAAERRLRER